MSTNDPAGGGEAPGPGDWRRSALRIAIALVALMWTAVLFGEKQRVQRDPRFCAQSCHHDAHPGASADFHARGHEGVACQDCHATDLRTGLRLVWATYTGSPSPPVVHGAATAKECAECHRKRPDEWRLVEETEGHRGHRDKKGIDCLSCHAAEVHAVGAEAAAGGPPSSSPSGACLKCHKDERLHAATAIGAETCLSCHKYAVSPKNIGVPTNVGCARCHDSAADLAASVHGAPVRPMKEVGEHALHAGVACQLCHNPHGITRAVPPGQPSCVACHKVDPDPNGPDEHRRCEACHEQHMPRELALSRCVRCHEKNAKGLLANGTATTTTALRHANCASCHQPHTWKAQRDGCMTCHKAETELFEARSPPQHKECVTCHEVHGPPPSGAICLGCHADTKGSHVALAPERHKDCTSCHNPHAPRPEDTRASCAKCHATEEAQVISQGPAPHAAGGCLTCHKPHDNPAPAPGLCATCHPANAKAVLAAEPPQHQVCTSCHERHVFAVADVEAACTRCHEGLFDTSNKPFARVPHQADCSSCHTFHGSPKVPQVQCLRCHDDVAGAFRPPNAKHADCDACHLSHTPASAAPARCAVCHAGEASVATSWPASSPHEGDCVACHRAHAAEEKKPCAECHAAEAASAMGGKHECKQCHAPHSAPPGTGAAWWSRCATCHESQVESVKSRGPVHSECKNCHQPHRFEEPTCASCHNDMSDRGLHGSPSHAASCSSCHDPHVEAPPTREQCLACHTDKRAHEPNAKVCSTCHLFR